MEACTAHGAQEETTHQPVQQIWRLFGDVVVVIVRLPDALTPHEPGQQASCTCFEITNVIAPCHIWVAKLEGPLAPDNGIPSMIKGKCTMHYMALYHTFPPRDGAMLATPDTAIRMSIQATTIPKTLKCWRSCTAGVIAYKTTTMPRPRLQ